MTAKVRVALFVAVSLLLSGTAFGQTTPKLNLKQKKERIKALPDEERKWLTDYVEPTGIENLSSCGGFRQPEVWSYQSSNGSSSLVQHLFYRPSFGAPRRLWTRGDRGIFEDSRVTSFDQLCAISQNSASCSCGLARIADQVASRGPAEVFAMGAAPKVSTEGLDALWERLASSSTPNAKAIQVDGGTGTAPSPSSQASPPPPAKPAATLSKSE